MTAVGIVGASGYTGAELLRLCAGHPELVPRVATGETQAGSRVADLYPSLAASYPSMAFETYDLEKVDGLDVVFLALPHGASQGLVPELRHRVGRIVDLAADFRLDDPGLYPSWYGAEHTSPELLGSFVYGLPELLREQIVDATAVAVAGCYPTTAALALAPLSRSGLLGSEGVVVDAASGVSGAGRAPSPATSFCTADEDFVAYGLLTHRHTPEMEQVIGVPVLFTPHLAPMSRGILATCYARPTRVTSTEELLELYMSSYAEEPFVVVDERPPSTKSTFGSNTVHVSVRYDERTGWIVALAALDNLVKGASGQALQCANLMLGCDEASGLSRTGVYP